MFRRTGLLLCCTAFFFLVGGHWAVLQSVAWAKMIVDYSKDDSLTTAVTKTFDGEHPCGMCNDISKSKKAEEKPATLKSDKKVESLASAIIPLYFFCDNPSVWLSCDAILSAGRTDAPPVPPPKFFLA